MYCLDENLGLVQLGSKQFMLVVERFMDGREINRITEWRAERLCVEQLQTFRPLQRFLAQLHSLQFHYTREITVVDTDD